MRQARPQPARRAPAAPPPPAEGPPLAPRPGRQVLPSLTTARCGALPAVEAGAGALRALGHRAPVLADEVGASGRTTWLLGSGHEDGDKAELQPCWWAAGVPAGPRPHPVTPARASGEGASVRPRRPSRLILGTELQAPSPRKLPEAAPEGLEEVRDSAPVSPALGPSWPGAPETCLRFEDWLPASGKLQERAPGKRFLGPPCSHYREHQAPPLPAAQCRCCYPWSERGHREHSRRKSSPQARAWSPKRPAALLPPRLWPWPSGRGHGGHSRRAPSTAPGPLLASGRRCPFPPRPAFPGRYLPRLPRFFSDPLQAWLSLGPLSPSPAPASHFKALPRKKLVCLPGRLSSLGKSPTFLLLDRCHVCHQLFSFLESETPRKNDPFSQVGPGARHSRSKASGLPRAPRCLRGGPPLPLAPLQGSQEDQRGSRNSGGRGFLLQLQKGAKSYREGWEGAGEDWLRQWGNVCLATRPAPAPSRHRATPCTRDPVDSASWHHLP
ncbi:uncharacterized protein LOC130684253 [Manis pentadactyla]|uniref:uncharacterized protein LOC130684253 n=1 Tax=Manis pentadactyla TaxID=143292 RepID=UPI00255C30B6|nr:uncharacterized protein LOC130684253 [Manis pentadactyla]